LPKTFSSSNNYWSSHAPIDGHQISRDSIDPLRAGVTDVSSHNLRKTFATRLLSRGAAITDVQHLLGHASVKTTEKAYAAFVKNERFKQTIDLLDTPVVPKLKVVR
jgi:integrase